jgi:RimJ/RimL family protein N-acetyltransferase
MHKLDPSHDYVLENGIVLLRPLHESDYDLLLKYSINEPELWKHTAGGADGPEKLKAYIANALKQRDAGTEYPFIVFDKKSNKYIGSTRFYEIKPERKTLRIGYTWYGKKYQGTGVNKNCKYLLLEFAFDKLEMARVGFDANNTNERSINAMKSIGCTVEGILRSNSIDAKDKRVDTITLSILKSEWDAELRMKLKEKIGIPG